METHSPQEPCWVHHDHGKATSSLEYLILDLFLKTSPRKKKANGREGKRKDEVESCSSLVLNALPGRLSITRSHLPPLPNNFSRRSLGITGATSTCLPSFGTATRRVVLYHAHPGPILILVTKRHPIKHGRLGFRPPTTCRYHPRCTQPKSRW